MAATLFQPVPDGDVPHGGTNLCVCSYNLLAPSLLKASQVPYASAEALRWQNRAVLFRDEITRLAAAGVDVFCFQEMEKFRSEFQDWLAELGYDCAFEKKVSASDGCCVAWNRSRFYQESHERVDFNDLAEEAEGFPADDLTRNNVGQVVVLGAVEPSRDLEGVVVGNAHLFWNPKHPSVRLLQATMLLRKAQQAHLASEARMPIVFCADFNDSPDSVLYQALTTRDHAGLSQRLEGKDEYRRACVDSYLVELGGLPCMRSAYYNYSLATTAPPARKTKSKGKAKKGKGKSPAGTAVPVAGARAAAEAPYTFYPGRPATIDFIMFADGGALQPMELLTLPPRDAVTASGGLPSEDFPSDHLPLASRFAVLPPG